MKYRKLFFKFLAVCLLLAFVIIGLLNERYVMGFIINDLHKRYTLRGQTIRELAKEITWQKYRAEKAHKQIPDFQELRFLAIVMETRDRDLFAVSKTAWKYGKQYQVNPYLILSVAHRESNFNPLARSYDSAGQPLAYGIMQINYRIWKDELKLDLALIDEIDYNIQQGTIILKRYIDKNPGDISRALWEYWGKGEINYYSPRVLNSSYFNLAK